MALSRAFVDYLLHNQVQILATVRRLHMYIVTSSSVVCSKPAAGLVSHFVSTQATSVKHGDHKPVTLFLQIAQDLIEYIRDTSHASEHLFNPLQMSPQLGVPGAYTGMTSFAFYVNKIRSTLAKR